MNAPPPHSNGSGTNGAPSSGRSAAETIRIRKYPNRRLYDTSRSCHLTHDGVLAVLAEGKSVQVTDSRSGADITNSVLLQILIERDPAKIAAIPSALIHRAMRSDVSTLKQAADAALAAWKPGQNAPSSLAGSANTIVEPVNRPTPSGQTTVHRPGATSPATNGPARSIPSGGSTAGNPIESQRESIERGSVDRDSDRDDLEHGSGGAGRSRDSLGSESSESDSRPRAKAKRLGG
ncbi:MAG: polyhydroxyalkanoate synthesis regulator DNA-binding domain-containing protein [Phycisphaerae bacterium]|nr:polyhydroxyalkanoate synthesis regulator DNA-binding domain-containing protein [Phycisphaerae bacterium]